MGTKAGDDCPISSVVCFRGTSIDFKNEVSFNVRDQENIKL